MSSAFIWSVVTGLSGMLAVRGSACPSSAAMAARMPTHPQSVVEQSRIPLFLATDRWGETMAVLDYERWEDLQHWTDAGSEDFVQVGAQQDYPLNFPMARTFYADGYARLRSADFESGHSVIRENHGELYLEP